MPWRLSLPSRARLRVGGSVTSQPRAQPGWQRGDFLHLVYVQAVAPTGESASGLHSYDRFAPAGHRHGLGLHLGTQAIEASVQRFRRRHVQLREYGDRLQDRQRISLRVGDWARVCNGACHWHCRLHYRQLTGDSGAGALIGPLKGSVDGSGSASVIRRSLTRPRSSSTCANITNSMPKNGGRAMRR
jgi:hypothetical protein